MSNSKVGVSFLGGVVVGMSIQSIYAYTILRRYLIKKFDERGIRGLK